MWTSFVWVFFSSLVCVSLFSQSPFIVTLSLCFPYVSWNSCWYCRLQNLYSRSQIFIYISKLWVWTSNTIFLSLTRTQACLLIFTNSGTYKTCTKSKWKHFSDYSFKHFTSNETNNNEYGIKMKNSFQFAVFIGMSSSKYLYTIRVVSCQVDWNCVKATQLE